MAQPPHIVLQPQSQTNAIGTPVTFTVSANGESQGYQWMRQSLRAWLREAELAGQLCESADIDYLAPSNRDAARAKATILA